MKGKTASRHDHSKAFWKLARKKTYHDIWLPAEEVVRLIPTTSDIVYDSSTLNGVLSKEFTGEILIREDLGLHVACRRKEIHQTTKEGKKKRSKRFYYISKSDLLPSDIPRETAPFQQAWENHESTRYYQASLLATPAKLKTGAPKNASSQGEKNKEHTNTSLLQGTPSNKKTKKTNSPSRNQEDGTTESPACKKKNVEDPPAQQAESSREVPDSSAQLSTPERQQNVEDDDSVEESTVSTYGDYVAPPWLRANSSEMQTNASVPVVPPVIEISDTPIVGMVGGISMLPEVAETNVEAEEEPRENHFDPIIPNGEYAPTLTHERKEADRKNQIELVRLSRERSKNQNPTDFSEALEERDLSKEPEWSRELATSP
eukprot:CAMPEP_0113635080 /NCGR_PEP_ID=MMETSP0017_2-20120614/18277_1 /TAXON_ID=2856 /ORGANISM="Cylindrotheca closterium" /LENGTH=373 /DNA_ID=CAMNT_0000545827 /DNA_START=53 /DNA_END=1171 /DNA_ORIENTATION=- /assembly_acc=CAM_ASM_000147